MIEIASFIILICWFLVIVANCKGTQNLLEHLENNKKDE